MENTQATYPEINAMNLADVTEALRLAYLNQSSVTAAALPELRKRIAALEDRRNRLQFVNRRNAKLDHITRGEIATGVE